MGMMGFGVHESMLELLGNNIRIEAIYEGIMEVSLLRIYEDEDAIRVV